jgi:hypothetical protein
MKRRSCSSVLSLLLVAPPAAAPLHAATTPSVTPKKLRIGDAVTSAGAFSRFVGPFKCDADGNVFSIPVALDARSRPMSPDTIVRLSADGKAVTRYSLISVPGIGNVANSTISTTALDRDGDLYAVVRAESGQYIVSFTKTGRYKWKIEIEPNELLIGSFAVFSSGEFLLSGRPASDPLSPRVVVLAPGSSSLRDVLLSDDRALKKGLSREARTALIDLASAESGSDGRVYFARAATKGSVYVVSPSGEITGTIALVPPRRGATLTSLKLSGHRLAAVYQGRPEEDSQGLWVAVHDISSGEHVASYGPVRDPVLCYQSVPGSPDRFTLLKMNSAGQIQFLQASAP